MISWGHPRQRHDKAYSSVSSSWLIAFFAIVWNACSTLIASLADVSKYGMLPLDWHQVIARFCDT